MHPLEKYIEAANSLEYYAWVHLQRAAAACLLLQNPATAEEAKEAAKSLGVAVGDLEKLLRGFLVNAGVPDMLVINVTARALRLWTRAAFDGLWANTCQYFQRWLLAPGPEAKMKELTALYFLVKNLKECAELIKAEEYYERNVLLQSQVR